MAGNAALVKLHLARGSVAPSGEVPPRSRAGRPLERDSASLGGWTPPRARSRPDRELSAPSSGFRLARGHHRPATSIPAPPTGGFNALTFAGAQVKDESMPRRAWESRPDTASPTPPVRPSLPLCDAVRHGQQQLRGTVPPTLVRSTCRTLEKGQRSPRRGDERILHARTRLHRGVRPVGAVTSVAISPVRPSLPSRRHPGHCITIPDAVEACGDRTPPRRLLCLVQPHVNGTLETSRGWPSNRRPLRRHPQSCSWTRTGCAMTPRVKQVSPGRPSSPWHCTPCLHT
jgi:hypothetical protein